MRLIFNMVLYVLIRHQLRIQEFRVRVAESVNTLLDIADNQIIIAPGEAFKQQRLEIIPLQARCVLKFINQEVAIAPTDALIDKRSLAVADNQLEQRVSVAQQYGVIVYFQLLGKLQNRPEKPVVMYAFRDFQCRIVNLNELHELRDRFRRELTPRFDLGEHSLRV